MVCSRNKMADNQSRMEACCRMLLVMSGALVSMMSLDFAHVGKRFDLKYLAMTGETKKKNNESDTYER